MILLAIPLTAIAFATRWQLHRTEGATTLARLGWALLVAVPFGVLMLVFAVIGGETEATNVSPSAGNTFALGLLWGVVGGLIGAATKLPLKELVTLPPVVQRVLTAVLATLRPLAAVLLTCTAIALVGWLVQVGADAGNVRESRSAPTALIEETVFAAEHGIHLTALGAGAHLPPGRQQRARAPVPGRRPERHPGSDGAFRIFSYDDELPAYVFLPALVILLSLNALGALYAGFAAARALGADKPADRGRLGRDHRTGVGGRDGDRRPARRWAVPRRRRRRLGVRRLPDRRRAARGRRGRAVGVRRGTWRVAGLTGDVARNYNLTSGALPPLGVLQSRHGECVPSPAHQLLLRRRRAAHGPRR